MDEHISLNVFMHYNKPMKNIIDYIKEYGNLTLEEYPFNNVGNGVLYVPLSPFSKSLFQQLSTFLKQFNFI